MSYYYLRKYKDKLCKRYLSENNTLTSDIIFFIGVQHWGYNCLLDVVGNNWSWVKMASYMKLDQKFVEKYVDNFTKFNLSKNKYLTYEAFKFKDNFDDINCMDIIPWDWVASSKHMILTLKFVKKYKDKLRIEFMSENKNLNLYIIKHIGICKRWDWTKISRNIELSDTFFLNCEQELDTTEIQYNPKLPKNLIKYITKKKWKVIMRNVILDMDFIKKNKRKIKIKWITYNKTLTFDMIIYLGINKKWNWNFISEHIKLENKYVEKYKSYLSYAKISKNKTLTLRLISECNLEDKLDWDEVAKNVDLSCGLSYHYILPFTNSFQDVKFIFH